MVYIHAKHMLRLAIKYLFRSCKGISLDPDRNRTGKYEISIKVKSQRVADSNLL